MFELFARLNCSLSESAETTATRVLLQTFVLVYKDMKFFIWVLFPEMNSFKQNVTRKHKDIQTFAQLGRQDVLKAVRFSFKFSEPNPVSCYWPVEKTWTMKVCFRLVCVSIFIVHINGRKDENYEIP